MDRRTFLASSFSAACGLGGLRAAPPDSPNVIILLADDLGWHDVGYHGSEIRTPNIDRLASQGVRFERAYSFPVCSPTRSGLMTGRSPMRLGVAYTVIRPWSDHGVPVAERFMPQAFHDAGLPDRNHGEVAPRPRLQEVPAAGPRIRSRIRPSEWRDRHFTHERDGGVDWNRNGKSVREEGYSTFLLGAEAERFIKQRDRARPFFLYVPFNSPHAPLQAPPEYLAKYSGIVDSRRRSFAAMTDAMDTTIGRLLAALEEERIADNTLVLFFQRQRRTHRIGRYQHSAARGEGIRF